MVTLVSALVGMLIGAVIVVLGAPFYLAALERYFDWADAQIKKRKR